jgi:RNA polymerase sigma-70 factor, ECF subfamily
MISAICLAPTGRMLDRTASKKTEVSKLKAASGSAYVAQIVEGCQRGDRGAQRQLYEQFATTVYRVAVRIVGAENADDVSQEVFLKAFRSIHQFAGKAEVGTWLYRITVNESLQDLRRSKSAHAAPLPSEPVDRSCSSTSRIQQQEILEFAMGSLPDDLRAILVLRETEDLSYSEISLTLNISEGTVASRINRARGELRRLLANFGWEF